MTFAVQVKCNAGNVRSLIPGERRRTWRSTVFFFSFWFLTPLQTSGCCLLSGSPIASVTYSIKILPSRALGAARVRRNYQGRKDVVRPERNNYNLAHLFFHFYITYIGHCHSSWSLTTLVTCLYICPWPIHSCNCLKLMAVRPCLQYVSVHQPLFGLFYWSTNPIALWRLPLPFLMLASYQNIEFSIAYNEPYYICSRWLRKKCFHMLCMVPWWSFVTNE